MKVSLLDTQTGKVATCEGISTFEWSENNWSCDCNRGRVFGHDAGSDMCIGCHRYLVIAAACESDDDWPASLVDLNADYPEELLRANSLLPDRE